MDAAFRFNKVRPLPEPNARFRFDVRAARDAFEPEREFEPKPIITGHFA
jgi:hypothetical protein